MEVYIMSIKSELIATKVDIELKEAFVAIARNKHRPASQILRDLIKEQHDNFIKNERGL